MNARLWSLPMATLTVTGPDALSWLNGLVTQELLLARDQGNVAQPSFFLTKQGKVRASLLVLQEPERLTLGVVNLENGAPVEALKQELDHYLVMEDAEIEVDTRARWFVGQMSDSERAAWGTGPVYTFPLLGPDAVFIVERGGPLAASNLPSLGAEWDKLRLEWGFPWFGTDYGSGDNPHEAGLERAYVSFSKGCYLGQEVVCMQEMRGKVKRTIVRLHAESASKELRPTAPVTSEAGDAIGVVTTAQGPRALAMLKAPHVAAGSVVWVEGARFSVSPLEPGNAWAV